MTTLDLSRASDLADADLVRESIAGSAQAFEVLVVRYQNLVCSVAFTVVGDVAASEDIGQESFVAAWQELSSINDPAGFKSWLCSIARHKALDSTRKRRPTSVPEVPNRAASLDAVENAVMKQEEHDFVWDTLSSLPLQYREPLVLYYRQEQSVSEVAIALDLSSDTVKQRLSRGRQMLREEVLSKIGDTLRGSGPRAAFTAAVLVSIESAKAIAGTAATVTTTSATKTLVAKSGFAGATVSAKWLAPLLAVLVGVFANWVQWSLIRYKNERQLTHRYTAYILTVAALFGAPYVALLFGWQPWAAWGHSKYNVISIAWLLTWGAVNAVQVVSYQILMRKLHERNQQDGSTPLPIGAIPQWVEAREGFHWTSGAALFGAPLLEINFGPIKNISFPTRYRKARAWIAIGDIAIGRFLGIGYFSLAPIAIGNMSCGLLAIATMSVGIVAFGAVAAGVFGAGAVFLGATTVNELP